MLGRGDLVVVGASPSPKPRGIQVHTVCKVHVSRWYSYSIFYVQKLIRSDFSKHIRSSLAVLKFFKEIFTSSIILIIVVFFTAKNSMHKTNKQSNVSVQFCNTLIFGEK
jgi:hypothetical protein